MQGFGVCVTIFGGAIRFLRSCVGRWHSLVVGCCFPFMSAFVDLSFVRVVDRSCVGCVRWLSLVVDCVTSLGGGCWLVVGWWRSCVGIWRSLVANCRW